LMTLKTEITEKLKQIHGADQKYHDIARKHLDSLTKPIGSLGLLEDAAARYVALRGELGSAMGKKAAYVFAADHGITEEGISAYPKEVTPQMVANFLSNGAAINVLSNQAGADVVVIDVGVDADFEPHPGLLQRKVRRGSRNFAREAAMSQQELEAALEVGLTLAHEAKLAGRTMIALGEMGIGNTTPASAITAAITGTSAAQVTGAGTGLDSARVAHKAAVIEQALTLHFGAKRGQELDPVEILRCVGGLEIAAITGMILGAAIERIAVVIDGFICTSGAAIACAMVPEVRELIFAGHQSEEPGHRILLDSIGQKPLLQLGMRLGEGTGAVLSFHLIEAAMKVYHEMATFASAGVSEAS